MDGQEGGFLPRLASSAWNFPVLLIAALSLTAAGLCISAESRRSAHRSISVGTFDESIDVTPVKLSIEGPLGGGKFALAKAYLGDKRDWKGGRRDQIHIYAAGAEMAPLTIYADRLYQSMLGESGLSALNDEAFKAEFDKRLFKEKIAIELSYGHDSAKTREMFPDRIKKRGHYRGEHNGLVKYDFLVAGHVSYTYYVPVKQESRPIFIDCPSGGSLVYLRCTAHTDYNKIISYAYSFHGSRLLEYKEINQRVRRFIDKIATP